MSLISLFTCFLTGRSTLLLSVATYDFVEPVSQYSYIFLSRLWYFCISEWAISPLHFMTCVYLHLISGAMSYADNTYLMVTSIDYIFLSLLWRLLRLYICVSFISTLQSAYFISFDHWQAFTYFIMTLLVTLLIAWFHNSFIRAPHTTYFDGHWWFILQMTATYASHTCFRLCIYYLPCYNEQNIVYFWNVRYERAACLLHFRNATPIWLHIWHNTRAHFMCRLIWWLKFNFKCFKDTKCYLMLRWLDLVLSISMVRRTATTTLTNIECLILPLFRSSSAWRQTHRK